MHQSTQECYGLTFLRHSAVIDAPIILVSQEIFYVHKRLTQPAAVFRGKPDYFHSHYRYGSVTIKEQ
jgi:hypothetical protein